MPLTSSSPSTPVAGWPTMRKGTAWRLSVTKNRQQPVSGRRGSKGTGRSGRGSGTTISTGTPSTSAGYLSLQPGWFRYGRGSHRLHPLLMPGTPEVIVLEGCPVRHPTASPHLSLPRPHRNGPGGSLTPGTRGWRASSPVAVRNRSPALVQARASCSLRNAYEIILRWAARTGARETAVIRCHRTSLCGLTLPVIPDRMVIIFPWKE